MKTVLKVLSVFFGLGFVGQLVAGNFFPAGLILCALCGHFGWKTKESEKNKDETTANK
jgi:hypothetical protein